MIPPDLYVTWQSGRALGKLNKYQFKSLWLHPTVAQVRLEFYEALAEKMEIETAVQLGCLEMRRRFKNLSQEALNKKSNINMLENVSY